MTLFEYSVSLAECETATFPMTHGKTPIKGSHGVNDATTDKTKLLELFSTPGVALVAIATGMPSGITVLDIDRQHGGNRRWQENRHKIPSTWTWRTRSGGLHLAMRHCPGLRTRTIGMIARGIEIRSTGVSAIYWPAVGFSLLCGSPPAPWPQWLVPPPAPAPQRSQRCAEGHPRLPEHVEAALAGICRTVATASPGSRNSLLFWGAVRCAKIISRGELSRQHAEAVLTECAARIGLDHIEIPRTIASAFNRRAA